MKFLNHLFSELLFPKLFALVPIAVTVLGNTDDVSARPSGDLPGNLR